MLGWDFIAYAGKNEDGDCVTIQLYNMKKCPLFRLVHKQGELEEVHLFKPNDYYRYDLYEELDNGMLWDEDHLLKHGYIVCEHQVYYRPFVKIRQSDFQEYETSYSTLDTAVHHFGLYAKQHSLKIIEDRYNYFKDIEKM